MAKYIFYGLKTTSASGVSLRWNTYIYAGQVKQVGLNSQNNLNKKYAWLLNYGKYNFSYVLFASNYAYCGSNS